MHIENAIKGIRGTSVAHLEPERKKGIFLYTKSNLVQYSKKNLFEQCYKIEKTQHIVKIIDEIKGRLR